MKLTVILPLVALCVVVEPLTPKKKFIVDTRTFAATFYKELISDKAGQNVIFSSITIQSLIAMIASASKNEQALVIQQIRKSLSLPEGGDTREAVFKNILEKLNKSTNDFKIFDATKIYFNSIYRAETWYQDLIKDIYKAEIQTVDFGNRVDTSQTINEWVAKKTENNIANFIDPTDITRNIQTLLINTLFLKGKWMKPFAEDKSFAEKFYSPYGDNDVTMMHNDNYTYGYYQDDDAQYLQLDMVRVGDASMVIVLPRQPNDLNSLEANIHNFLRPIKFVSTKVTVTLPKFSFSNDLNIKENLKHIGVTRLFQWGGDLLGLRYPGHPYVTITNVIQKAFIDVNEWGVTATAGSGGTGYIDKANVDPKTFTANRPFFFYIRLDDAVVFAGRVVKL